MFAGLRNLSDSTLFAQAVSTLQVLIAASIDVGPPPFDAVAIFDYFIITKRILK
jgi:hypothetical protein